MAGTGMIFKILTGFFIGVTLCIAQPAADSTGDVQPVEKGRDSLQAKTASVDNSQTEPVQAGAEAVQNRMSLFSALDEGQAMRGVANRDLYAPYFRLWQQDMVFHISDELIYLEKLRFILSIESKLTFSYKQDNRFPATLSPEFAFYPSDIEINYTFGNLDRPWLRIGVGYFPFKYNPDAKDLGEFLLRGLAYPTVIKSDWEFAMTRELGFHVNGVIGNPSIDQIKWDLMFTTETHEWPLQDWTVTAVASNNLLNCVDVGGGASLQRFLPVNESKTTPKIPSNSYLNASGDTAYYTFKSIKLMGRGSLSPLALVPEFRIPPGFIFGDKPFFSKEDLRIYGELAVLGLQNQTAYIWDTTGTGAGGVPHLIKAPKDANYYDSLGDRMPYMIGVNLPTHPLISYGILPFLLTKWLKDETGDDIRPLAWVMLVPALASGVLDHYLGCNLGLDVLSLEYEWDSQRYPNDDYNPLNFNGGDLPLPASNSYRLSNLHTGTPQQAKYALYFKKSFGNQRFAVSGLVARDHMRPPYHGEYVDAVTDDFLQTKNEWWWTLRLSANF